jgi:hypothetical protein
MGMNSATFGWKSRKWPTSFDSVAADSVGDDWVV